MFSRVSLDTASQCPASGALCDTELPLPHAVVDASVQTEPIHPLWSPCWQSEGDATSIRHRMMSAELPNEIWGEIVSFSSRCDVLNLRAVRKDIKEQADTMISTLTLHGNQALIDFAYTNGFKDVRTVNVRAVDHLAMSVFARRLATHPRKDLTMNMADCLMGMSGRLHCLSALPLAELRLDGVYVTPEMTVALKDAIFPIALKGYMAREELQNAASIPTLTDLSFQSTQFADDVAFMYSTHPAIQHLAFPVNQSFSSAGLEYLAAIPTLRSLHLYDTVFMANEVSVAAGQKLGAHKALESLSLHTRINPLSEACLAAISTSLSLRSLSIAFSPNIHLVTRMFGLERLELSSRCHGSNRMDSHTAILISIMPCLRFLRLELLQFGEDAFRSLVTRCQAEVLQLEKMRLSENEIVSLLANTHLKVLTLDHVQVAPQYLVALCQHATLRSVLVDGAECKLRAAY